MNQTALEPGVLIQGRYELRRLLGQGGMGSVWAAWHQGLQIEIAVKFVETTGAKPAEMVARFQREAGAVARIKSPHVVTILDHGFDEEHQRPFIAMELLTGESLGDRLRRDHYLSLRDTVVIVRQVLRGLGKAHEAQVVHRDLKPDNLFLCQDDELLVKILDFGIAKTDFQLELTGHSGPQTRTGAILGTPNYMSPEQTMGNRTLDHRSDLYAMGVVAFHCLTGSLPFNSTGLGELLVMINTQPIPSIRNFRDDIPEAIDQWVTQALAKKPDARFQSAKEMSAALVTAFGTAFGQGDPLDSSIVSYSSGENSSIIIQRPAFEQVGLAATLPGAVVPPGAAEAPEGPGTTVVLPLATGPAPVTLPTAGLRSAATPTAGLLIVEDVPPARGSLPTEDALAADDPPVRQGTQTVEPTPSIRGTLPTEEALSVGGSSLAVRLPKRPAASTQTPRASLAEEASPESGSFDSSRAGDSLPPEEGPDSDPLAADSAPIADTALSMPPTSDQASNKSIRPRAQGSRGRSLAGLAFVLVTIGGAGLWANSARLKGMLSQGQQVTSIGPESVLTGTPGPSASVSASASGSARPVDSPYQQACDKGDAHSCASLGLLYESGRGVVPDRSAAAALFLKACEGGDAIGCANLGMAYEVGRGVPKDESHAAQLYQQACDGGDTRSCHYLGALYESGRGVGKEVSRAAQLYQKACDGAYLASCGALGILHERGDGVPQDKMLASQLFQKTCDGGNAGGCGNLGAMYEKGDGVKQDKSRAAQLFQKGCEGGSARSCNSLGYLSSQGTGVPKDRARAALLYQKACDGGSVLGCSNLGFLYEKGDGVKQDKSRAALLFQQACDGGHSLGCHGLAGMYERGDGPAKDKAAALRFYQKACNAGYDPSCKALRRLK